jgi:glyoxylase-like metal-dependent hydrolase (beta-lactamase superfamily II)
MIKISVGPMDNNAYLLQPRTGASILIDAANDHDRLLTVIDDQPIAVIATTHRHGDHWQALASIAAATRLAWSPADQTPAPSPTAPGRSARPGLGWRHDRSGE